MTTGVPAGVQETLALLMAASVAVAEDRPRVSDVYARWRQVVVPRPDAAVFDEQLDGLIGRGYVDTEDTRVGLSEYGRVCLSSLAELAAAGSSRVKFDRLTDAGWQRLLHVVEGLPDRYGSRGGDNFVYVVLLHPDVKRLRRFRDENGGSSPQLPAIYVGMSSRAPLQRFRNHKRGRKSSRYVRKYGLCLLPEHFGHLNPLDRYGAQEMEIDLAVDLRRQGFGVMGVYETRTADGIGTADYAKFADM